MSEQILVQPLAGENSEKVKKAKESLEKARVAHERYLIRQNNKDLQDAITNYIEKLEKTK